MDCQNEHIVFVPLIYLQTTMVIQWIKHKGTTQLELVFIYDHSQE